MEPAAGTPEMEIQVEDLIYDALMASAAVACALHVVRVRKDRLPWLLLGIALLLRAAGETLPGAHSVVDPTLADSLHLFFYPVTFVALAMMLGRIRRLATSLWLDGVIGAMAVGAGVAALAWEPITRGLSGEAAAVAVNLAYPLGDLVVLGFVVAAFGMFGWRPNRGWALLGVGLAALSASHMLELAALASGGAGYGVVLDVLPPAAALLVGLAALLPSGREAPPSLEGWPVVIVPYTCSLVALGLLMRDQLAPLGEAALVLSFATLTLVTVRMAVGYLEHQRLLSDSRREALTDALTGLRNRRSLMEDLEVLIAEASAEDDRALVLFDLDGFKLYNDTFGHPAGDVLLARLGRRLREAVCAHGRVYRLGGDEFCALVRPGPLGIEPIVAAAVAALSEHGDAFEVVPSHGTVAIPGDTAQATEALQLADRRMYAQKGGRRSSPGRQSRDVLLRALLEREPQLHAHLRDVADLALTVGRVYGMAPEELDELARAAELHDVGKVAIPDAILSKRGPLDEAEWSFMRRHTVIGERILGAAPALRPVARLVRSSHEHWDGSGYPDGLLGEEIPLGARIVAVCDAFHAITSDRAYAAAESTDAALSELRRCAGTQFDPGIVAAFCALFSESTPAAARAATPA
jgi:two-component system cell cycle response regulator